MDTNLVGVETMTPAERTRYNLRRNYLLGNILLPGVLLEVRMGDTQVQLCYQTPQGTKQQHDISLDDWLRLQTDEVAESLDVLLGEVPITALSPVAARVPHIEVVPEPEPVAELAEASLPQPELVAEVVVETEPEPVQNEFRFALHARVLSHKTGKQGTIYRRDHYDCKVTYGVNWEGSMVGQANCPDAELLPMPTEQELAGQRKYDSPEHALSLGVGKPDCWYYVRFTPSSMTTDPKVTAIEALLLNGIGTLLYVPSTMANDCNVYDVRDMSLSYAVALAHFLGRMVGALVLYNADDELPEGRALAQEKRFLDNILLGPEPLTLADISDVIQEYAPGVGGMTRSRCELLFRLFRMCEKFQASSLKSHLAQQLLPLREGFSCDAATPVGYALRVSAYKAKPLFTPAETRLLKELLQLYNVH